MTTRQNIQRRWNLLESWRRLELLGRFPDRLHRLFGRLGLGYVCTACGAVMMAVEVEDNPTCIECERYAVVGPDGRERCETLGRVG